MLRATPLTTLATAELPKCVAAAEAEERLAASFTGTEGGLDPGAGGDPAATSGDAQADCQLSRWAARRAAELAITSLEGFLAEASPGKLFHFADSSQR